MELMDNIFKCCTMKSRLPRQHFVLLSVKLVERKKKIDSPKHMNLPGRSFQKNANEKSFFRSSCCTVFKETNIISEVVLEIFGNSWKGFSYGGQ